LHPEARLTDSERQQIYRWTRAERSRLSLLHSTTSLNGQIHFVAYLQ